MAKKSFGLIMLAAVLAFGMAVTGCGHASPVDGRWAHADDPRLVYVFENGIVRAYLAGELVLSGTFTASGNTITMTFTEGGVTETPTATFALSNNNNTLTLTGTEGGETFSEVWHRQR